MSSCTYSEIMEHFFGIDAQSAMESGGLFEEGGAENVENWVVYKVCTVPCCLYSSAWYSAVFFCRFDEIFYLLLSGSISCTGGSASKYHRV